SITMKISRRWRTASLVAGALVIGTIVGPPLAQAATASLIRLEGGSSSNVASVAGTGQLQVAQANPGSLVIRVGAETCAKNGFYKVPAGKALILTAVDFYNGAPPNDTHNLLLLAGPAASPCGAGNHLLAADSTASLAESQNQTFPTGIAIPAGDALALF